MGSIWHRIRQGIAAFDPRLPATLQRDLRNALTEPQREAFYRLSRYDQRHLHRVYLFIRKADPTNIDLRLAALLHYIGNSALGGQVRLSDRISHVLLARVTPSLYAKWTRLPASGWRLGLALCAHHPALGAEMARDLGLNERVCWLIHHHADNPLPDDIDLLLLAHADRKV